jgi:hypothetical protein
MIPMKTFTAHIRLMIILYAKPKSDKLALLKQYQILNGFTYKIIKVLLMFVPMFSTVS